MPTGADLFDQSPKYPNDAAQSVFVPTQGKTAVFNQ